MSIQNKILCNEKITKYVNKLSKIFQPINVLPKDAKVKKNEITSKSQRLMIDLGLIRQGSPGSFHLLPLGLRSMKKLIKIVDSEMKNIDAQKVTLSSLTSTKIWKTTGRLETGGNELFILKDRHDKEYILNPTHEESITDLLASVSPVSYKHFPLRLYQTTTKFRDEMKPRFGIMRSREFIMKDLYTFDIDVLNARKTYTDVCNSYDSIFNTIGLKFVKVLGSSGNIGGSISHEYHFPADIGEDRLLTCRNCNYVANVELCPDEKCPKCDSSENCNVNINSGIEVGHTFLLGDKYSKPLHAKYLGLDGKPYTLQMGCYGLGLSRILAASVEVLSSENELRWPLVLAPFNVVIIPPKAGSKEESTTTNNFVYEIYSLLENLPQLKDNILIDDRIHMTIGKRFFEAKKMGYPFIIIIGSTAAQDPAAFEIYNLISNNKKVLLQEEIFHFIKENLVNK